MGSMNAARAGSNVLEAEQDSSLWQKVKQTISAAIKHIGAATSALIPLAGDAVNAQQPEQKMDKSALVRPAEEKKLPTLTPQKLPASVEEWAKKEEARLTAELQPLIEQLDHRRFQMRERATFLLQKKYLASFGNMNPPASAQLRAGAEEGTIAGLSLEQKRRLGPLLQVCNEMPTSFPKGLTLPASELVDLIRWSGRSIHVVGTLPEKKITIGDRNTIWDVVRLLGKCTLGPDNSFVVEPGETEGGLDSPLDIQGKFALFRGKEEGTFRVASEGAHIVGIEGFKRGGTQASHIARTPSYPSMPTTFGTSIQPRLARRADLQGDDERSLSVSLLLSNDRKDMLIPLNGSHVTHKKLEFQARVESGDKNLLLVDVHAWPCTPWNRTTLPQDGMMMQVAQGSSFRLLDADGKEIPINPQKFSYTHQLRTLKLSYELPENAKPASMSMTTFGNVAESAQQVQFQLPEKKVKTRP